MPPAPPPAPIATSKLDTAPGNATAALYSAAIGPISIDYYLPLFTRFESEGHWRLAWNWAACLYTVNWMIFRGLERAAMAYAVVVAGIALLLFGVGRLVLQWSPGTEMALLAALIMLLFGVPGLLGNRWLHAASRQKMGNALRDSVTLADACALLARQASSRRRFLWLVSVNALFVSGALGLYGWTALQAGEPVIAPAPSAQPSPPAQLGASSTTEAQPIQTPTVPVFAPEPELAASAPPASPARQRFYINVGLFAKEANALKALDKLEQANLPTLSGIALTPRGERTRVRAGPYNSLREAEAAAITIRALNLDAVVVQQSP